MEFSAILGPLQPELDAVRDSLTANLASAFEVFEVISRSATAKQQGKLLRPALFLLSAKAFGEITPNHLEVAGALELIHVASLAHDDVIDSAGLRRRRPTIRARWGNTISVLYGDFLLAKAFSILSATPLAVARRLAPPLVVQVIEGEAMQHQARGNVDLDKEEYLDMVRKKTGALFAAAGQIGGAANGAQEPALSALLEYGYSFGTGYQILDDILDLVGSERETGKTVMTDLRSGRFTLPVLLLRDALPTATVRECIRDASDPGNDLAAPKVAQLAWESGAVARAAEKAMELMAAARSCLHVLPCGPWRERLDQMAICHAETAEEFMERHAARMAGSVRGTG